MVEGALVGRSRYERGLPGWEFSHAMDCELSQTAAAAGAGCTDSAPVPPTTRASRTSRRNGRAERMERSRRPARETDMNNSQPCEGRTVECLCDRQGEPPVLPHPGLASPRPAATSKHPEL